MQVNQCEGKRGETSHKSEHSPRRVSKEVECRRPSGHTSRSISGGLPSLPSLVYAAEGSLRGRGEIGCSEGGLEVMVVLVGGRRERGEDCDEGARGDKRVVVTVLRGR